MSRIGKKAISIPDGVEAKFQAPCFTVKGKNGQQELDIPDRIKVEIVDKEIKVQPVMKKPDVKTRMLWGTIRARIANIITGVTEGFSKKLEINGVGYRAAIQGKKLELNLGYSHPIKYAVPEGIEVKVNKNEITISGFDRQLVGQVAANIRAFREPEPYKGKGIKYSDEQIRRKEMKKAVAEGEGES